MIFAAILAGGTGSRMKLENMPKQFLLLGDKPIFIHTIQKFLLVSEIDRVFLGIHPEWIKVAEKQLAKENILERVTLVPGGGDRNGTIQNLLNQISTDYGENPNHIIITHDSVRPFVSIRTIRENILVAKEFGACDTVIPATDTIVESTDGDFISGIPLRGQMYQGQTPQTFQLGVLRRAYESLNEDDMKMLTDACKAVLLSGTPVKLIQGGYSNIKLTTVMDYNVAQALIHRLPEE